MLNKETKTLSIQFLLFVLTIITTTFAGAGFMNFETVKHIHREDDGAFWDVFISGLWYSIPFLSILTIHEFGHYFMAKYHKLKVTLPYYIPFWLPGMVSIGTLGAVIKLKSPTQSKKQFFDVGVAGPLAGFVAALVVLYYGFTHLAPYQDILLIHPEYQVYIDKYGADYAVHAIAEMNKEGVMLLGIGDNLLFWFFKNYVASNPADVPGVYEVMHYPFLFAGYLALFFTSLNLLPIGQLDGGHVLYGLIGKEKQDVVSRVFFLLFVSWAGIGLLNPKMPFDDLLWQVPLYGGFLYFLFMKVFESKTTALTYALGVFAFQFVIASIFPLFEGYNGWLVFAFILSRVLGVYHPRAFIEEPLNTKRKIIGWVALLVFVLCFSPTPFVVEVL